jgi:hypothetical protein
MEPALSVVLVADSWNQARGVARAVARQDGAEGVELILVGPERPALAPDPDPLLDRLHSLRVLGHPRHARLHESRALGIREAAAPLVQLAETHAFPQPGWLKALLDAHADGAIGVGAAMLNGNPRTATSWAGLLLDYAAAVAPVPAGPGAIPAHNSAFRRDAILDGYGDRLEEWLVFDWFLAQDLAEQGADLRFEPRARTRHLNAVGRWFWEERVVSARCFAARRARDWGAARRALYALGSPLIPLLRAREMRTAYARVRDELPKPRRVALVVAGGLVASAAGEALGYARGASEAAEARAYELELDKAAFAG